MADAIRPFDNLVKMSRRSLGQRRAKIDLQIVMKKQSEGVI